MGRLKIVLFNIVDALLGIAVKVIEQGKKKVP